MLHKSLAEIDEMPEQEFHLWVAWINRKAKKNGKG